MGEAGGRWHLIPISLSGFPMLLAASPPHIFSWSSSSSPLSSHLLSIPPPQFASVPSKITSSSICRREECVCVCVCVCVRVLSFNLPSSSPPVSLAVPAPVALSSATNQRFSKQELRLPVSLFISWIGLYNRSSERTSST